VHILTVTPTFAPEVTPEASRALAIVKAWVTVGVRVTVLTTVPQGPNGDTTAGYRNRLWQTQPMAGYDIVRIWSAGQRHTSFAVMAALQAKRLPKADVVLVTAPPASAAALGRRLARRLQVPLVLDLMDTATPQPTRIRQMLMRQAAADAAHIIATSSHALEPTLIQPAATRTTTLAPGTDLTLFDAPVYPVEFRRLHGLTGAFVAGIVGPLDDRSDLATILAAAAITKDDPDIAWLIAGQGPAHAALVAQKRELGLSNVIFAPVRTRDEQPMIWSAIDAAVVPLRTDHANHIPASALDAMAMRRPLVISTTAATRQLIERASIGLTVTPGNAAALADSVRRIKADPSLAQNFSDRARTYVMAHHDQHQLSMAMLDCLRTVARKPA
jgi:colanic acid biosynthesis glycosyl transferase WcaI